ncbi:stAR-related lipid transfer protein 9 isoform X1 [Tachysurus ichikawai]
MDVRTEAPGDSRERLLEFPFDYCYWSVNPEAPNYASQEEVFQDLGMCVLTGAAEGYNVCLFAYGQTGSGKTYTMMGNPDSIGLTPRICQGLFRSGINSPDGQTCRVEVSFLEIYNERVRDLLRGADQKKPVALRVREHPEKGPYVQGLTQHVVEDYKQAADLLEVGIANRITAATHVHDASSRSHAIFSIQYTQAILENNLPSEIVSKINLVDLAGSERADPNYCRDRITEGANINKSLVTLGIVISALAQNSQMCSSSQSINSMLSEGESSSVGSQSSSLSSSSRRHCFIPYRDSVLTWLLKDSLGGNSKTIMIATISPSCSSYSETLSTLRYAAHAKNIVNKPRVNEDASVRLIRDLREEIDRLKSMLLSFSMRNPSPSLSDERDSSLSDIVLQNELKIEQLTKDWSESWQDKRALLEQYSVDINQDRAGVQIHSLQPHLISLEPDVLSTGVTIYHLREGITKIGPQDPKEEEPHIDIPEGSLCEIENQNGVVTLKPRAHTICMVNNRQVTEPCRLAQGAVITLAGRQKYRFNHPAEAAALRERRRIIDGGPLNALTPNSRAEEVGSKEASDRLAPWQRLEEHQRYVECLREEILVEQRRAEKDLEREQAHLCKQHSEIQQWILQEKQRLAAIREKGTLDSGVQTDIIPLPALTGINENESSRETIHPSLIVGDRKRVVQEELLKHHALRRNENRIRRKRLRYQLERIARKRHLLEAKQGLQRLETALSLGVDAPLSPDIGSSSKRREHPMMLRRHSFSVDLLSRLYPQHAPIFSQFLRRNRLSESTSSLSSATFPRKWVSDECLPGKTRGRSNTMPSRCSQGTSIGTDSSENIKILMKVNVPSEEMTERKSLSSPLQSSIWNHNISVKTTMDSDTRDSRVLPIIKQSSKQKNSPNGERSSPNEVNKGLETIRKALSRSVGFGIKKALSRVFRKPPLGSRGGKGAKSASRLKAQFAVEGKKDKNFEDMATKQPHSPIKSTLSCDGLDQLISFKEKKQGRWHSAETLNKTTRRWDKMQQDLTNWVESNGDEVADDSSDCDSLFSVDSLSSAYAIALAEQLQQEDCEPSEADSVESQMSKDSLVKESSDPISALKLSHSICHTFNSSPIESKEMIEIFRSQKVTRQEIKEFSHFSQITSDSQHHSDASIKETEAFLALTDAWSSADPADSPRILGALELKQCILSDTSSSQSQASLELSGLTGYECQIPPCFDSTQGKDVTVKERSHISSEREMVLDYFLSDLTSTSCSTPECTLLQGNNEQLNNLEALSTSAEAFITQNAMSNDTLCANKPTSPSELAPLETSVVDMLAVNAPFQNSVWKSSDNGLKSNFKNQTELILSSDESVFTKGFAQQNNLIESKTHSEERCIAVTPFRDSNIFSKSDGQTLLELQHSHSTLQSEDTLKISNKFICSNKDLHQSAMQSMNTENDFQCKPQSLMVNHNEKKVSDEKSLVLHRVQSTDKYSESYDSRNSKDYPFLEMNMSDSANKEVSDFVRHCDAVMQEHESCNIHSRKRSKDIQDDLAGNLNTPKRSCVESLVSDISAVNNVPYMFNDSRGNSTGKLLPVETDITDNLSQTFQQVSITASMDGHIEIYQNNNNPAASFTSEDRPVPTGIKMSTGCPVGMQNLKCPDLKLVDNGMFDSSVLRKISHAINDKISEVVKEHLKISLQVENGEDINKEPETNSEKSLTTSIDALTKPQNKNEMTAEDSLRSSHTSQCVTEYCADDRVNVDNTNDCVRDKYLVKNPTEKKVIVDHQGVGFHGSSSSLLVKNINAEIENLDTYDSYGPVPQDLKINVLEATTVLLEGPTDNHQESLITSHSNGSINEVTSESNTIPLTFPLTLMSTCKQNPEVLLSSENFTVAEEQDQFFLMKTKSIPINISPEGPSVKTEDNGFNLLSHTKHKPVIYPEVNSISVVSNDSCVVTVSTRCSEALVDHVDHVKEAVKTVKASKVNLVAKFQQVVELNTVAHLDTEAANQFQMKNEHSFNSDGAENDSSPLKKLAYQECAKENHEFSTQEQPHVGQNTNSLNEAKDKIMDLENHNCLGKPQEEPTVSKSCQALALARSSGQVDEIMLVYSSEHENQEIKQDSRKCDHGTQTVKVDEDVEKKCKHKRSSTQVLVPRTSTAWTSLQNMSEHLSELIVNTSDLLGNIQCMRTGESSMKKGPPCSKVSKIRSDKYAKGDSCTQTATDVGIQTEVSALLMKQNKVLQRTSPVKNPKSHEVNVIVKVISSEVCNIPKQECATKSIRDKDESRQSFETIKSMPDLRPGGSPPSEQFCRKLDSVKNLSLETVGPNQYRYNPVTVDHKASNTFGVCAQRKCTSQVLAKDNQIHMKPKNYPDKRVLLIDRASSPILTVDVTLLQKRKIRSGTINSPTEMLSKTNRNPPENKSVSSMSFENLRSHSCVNAGSPDAYSTEASPSIYVQNGRKKPSRGVQSKVASQEILCSPLSHSHSSAVKHRQPVDLSHNTLLSSTPINHSHRSSMQEYKHRVYKEMSCWSDLSKDTFQYKEEDSMSLALSDCNTEVLVSINPLAEISPPQEDYGIPENLPMHNKFTNWSGISQQPPDRLTNKNNSTVGKSPDINRHSLHLHSAESESLGYRYKPDLPESIHRRTREIERLRKEREQVLASMQLDLSPHPLSVELTEAKLHYGLGKTDTLLTMLKSSARTESTICTKQQLYDRHRRSIDGLRREREDRLQTSRRARSLSPSKHPNSTINMTEQSQRAPPSRQQEHLQQLRKEVVEMCRVPNPPKREGQYPTDIELLLRDYSRAREEAKTEIAKARVRLRERTEQEKRRLEQQALSHSVKDHLKLCTRVSNSTLCTGSNLSLSSGPTSGYNSGNAALLKDGTSPSIQVTGISARELKVRSRPPMIPSQSLQAPRAWLSAQDIHLESSCSGYELHSSSFPSSPPGRQRTCSFSSPLSVSIPYQDIADCTLTSAISEVHLASGGDVRNLLAGKAEAGWRHQGIENRVQTFYRPSSRPSSHGFLGAMELERPLASLWSLIRDHSKTHLYNNSLKSTWTRLLDDTTQLVYLLTDPSNCHMKQPRDFCCLSIESKQDDMWVLAMQSVFEESLPRPSVDTVRGEMFPSAWILQHSHRQGREIVTVIYLLQVDLGTPTLPQRLVNEVARKQAAVIADLDSFLSL